MCQHTTAYHGHAHNGTRSDDRPEPTIITGRIRLAQLELDYELVQQPDGEREMHGITGWRIVPTAIKDDCEERRTVNAIEAALLAIGGTLAEVIIQNHR